MKFIITFSSLSLLLLGCSTGGTFEKPNSTGRAGELCIVVDGRLRNSESVKFLKEKLSQPVVGLPQEEPLFDITTIPSDRFTAMFRMMRNLIVINIDPTLKRKSLTFDTDYWAKNQAVVRVNISADSLLLPLLQANALTLSSFFLKEEQSRLVEYYKANSSVSLKDSLRNKFGISLSLPRGYTVYKGATNFYWLEQEIGTIQQGLLIYSFNLDTISMLPLDLLLSKRDSVLKAHIPGRNSGSFMVTEYQYEPTSRIIEINTKKVMFVAGLWRIQGDAMGGPFVLTAFVDMAKNRVVVLDGFVYAPEKPNKRNYIRQLEAIMQTFSLNN